ncbi:hypothetical protein SLA2020_317720 [Shorea laevis]
MTFKYLFLDYALSCLLLLLLKVNNAMSKLEEYQTFIIQVDYSHKPASFLTHEAWHCSTLRSLSNLVDDEEMFLYSYNHVIHGFSARLTPTQLSEIEKSPAHISTFKESFSKLFTTHSPKFLGLKRNFGLWHAALSGEGMIIEVIDAGIWPESESFSDKGMQPVPQRWEGKCESGTAFSASACNNKLIGARFFTKGIQAAGTNISTEFDYNSPRDADGHGTHTSSTAAGNYALGASHFGYAKGTAKGVPQRAYVAMYKALWMTEHVVPGVIDGMTKTDVLAAMDQAIADGVDVLSLSLGFDQEPYHNDVIATASLSAIEKGIVVVCTAGNDRSFNSTYNGAP